LEGPWGWYDGTYMAPMGNNYVDPVRIWSATMSDSRYIKGYEDFYDVLIQGREKVERILDADVVITHVCPLSNSIAFKEKVYYDNLKTNHKNITRKV